MNRLYIASALAAGCAAFLLPSLAAPTQTSTSASRLNVGKVDVDFDYGKLLPGFWHLTGHVKMASESYDLAGEDIKVYFATGKSGASGLSSLTKATAEGSLGTGKQVIAHIHRPLQGQDYEVLADHAVYVPDATRPGGGKMDFTGHVKVTTNSGFLAEPSVSTFTDATILLGKGDDYPQLQTHNGHITLTPAQ